MQPIGLFPTAFWGLDDRRADRDYKLPEFFLTDKLLRVGGTGWTRAGCMRADTYLQISPMWPDSGMSQQPIRPTTPSAVVADSSSDLENTFATASNIASKIPASTDLLSMRGRTASLRRLRSFNGALFAQLAMRLKAVASAPTARSLTTSSDRRLILRAHVCAADIERTTIERIF
jgi:hypothetical protein